MSKRKKTLLQNNLLCCRVCLMTDCRLYNIDEYNLADTFARISGSSVSKDRLPQYLCPYCLVLLLKCSSFRDMCMRTVMLLTPALLKGTLDINYVRKLQPTHLPCNLTKTNIETIEVDPSKDLFNKQRLNQKFEEQVIPDHDIDDYYPEVDVEQDAIDTDDDDSNVVITEELFLNSNKNNKSPKKKKKVVKTEKKSKKKQCETNVNKNIVLLKQCNDAMDIDKNKRSETNVNQNVVLIKQCNEAMDIDKNLKKRSEPNVNQNVVLITQCNKPIDKNLVVMGKENKEEMKVMTIEVKDNIIEINNVKVDENNDEIVEVQEDGMTMKRLVSAADTDKFLELINHKIVTLSKEEQLEEIAERKKSRNYLECPFKCEDCGKGFGVVTSYENHRAKHSPSSGPHACGVCGVRMHYRSLLHTHERRHQLKFICNECNFVSRDKNQALKHYGVHAGRTYTCPHCEKIFLKSTTYLSHVRLMHPEANVDCLECGETFVSLYGLRQHYKRVHQFVCTICSADFTNKEALAIHAELAGEHIGKDLHACEQCGENCESETALKEHMGIIHPDEKKEYPCDKCTLSFNNELALDTHTRRKHLGQRYQNWSLVDRQRRAAYQKVKALRKKYKQNNQRSMCDQCGKLVRSAFLEYHKVTHLAVKPHACPHCPKTFATRYTLQDHLRSHTGEKPHQCTECPLAFAIKGNLKRHYNVTHLNKREIFPCPLCESTATTKASLKVHIQAVHRGGGWPRRDRSQRKKSIAQ
ncbi:zinc finger protein 813-like isoform X2 [Leguminivora glycinivorella]|uniref:zinc finger protein 813-like isoform X2 n=1 Tax=Leguminivora glycinivorella TaxID=1035111 RepID=UPI00200C3B68|nr:zinc finger protein 813-like isoform X2 [Leguminivora glycinivorella]